MKIGKPTFSYSFFSLLSKITGYIRDLFLAAFLGTGILADIFFIALKIPNSFRRSISEETFNSAYIPVFGRLRDSQDQNKQFLFARKILIILGLVFIPLIIIVEIFMPVIVQYIAIGIEGEEEFSLLVKVSRIIFPYLLFIAISSVFIGTLNANNKFALASALPIFLNFSLIISILSFPFFGESKITFISWSVLFGGIVQMVLLFATADKQFWKEIFSLKRHHTKVKRFFELIWPTFLSSTLLQINMLVGLLLASFITGAVSILYFAERVYFLPLSLIAISIGTVLIPNLANSLRVKDMTTALDVQWQAYRYSILTILPATFCLVALSEEVIEILYQRGEFTYESTRQTSFVLKLFLIGLPFATLVKILTPYFFAIEKPKIPLKVSLYTVIFNLALTIWLFQYINFIAIPIGLSISSCLNLLLLLIEHKKQNFFKLDSMVTNYFLKYLLLSVLLFLILWVFNYFELGVEVLFFDFILKVLLIFILWITFIYKFDKEIGVLISTTIKRYYLGFKSD